MLLKGFISNLREADVNYITEWAMASQAIGPQWNMFISRRSPQFHSCFASYDSVVQYQGPLEHGKERSLEQRP